MESRKEIHERYIKNLESHISSAKDATKYSSDRFDILLISLSTSSLILSIGFLDKVIPSMEKIDTSLLKTSWLLFIISIVSNLISQITGYYANLYEIKVSKNLIRMERERPVLGSQKSLETFCKNLNNCTMGLNLISFLTLIIGISILVLFISNQI